MTFKNRKRGPIRDCRDVFKGSWSSGCLALRQKESTNRNDSFSFLGIICRHGIVFSIGFGIAWLLWYFLWQTVVAVVLFIIAVAVVDVQLPYPVFRYSSFRRRCHSNQLGFQGHSPTNQHGEHNQSRNDSPSLIQLQSPQIMKETITDTNSAPSTQQKLFLCQPHYWSTELKLATNQFISIQSFHLDVLAWWWFSTSWEFQTIRYVALLDTFIVVGYLIAWGVKKNSTWVHNIESDFLNSGLSINILAPILIGCITTTFVQVITFIRWMLRDVVYQPSITNEFRLPIRSSHIACYTTEEMALKLNRKNSTNIFPLFSVDPIKQKNDSDKEQRESIDGFPSFEKSCSPEWYFSTFRNFHSIPLSCHQRDIILDVKPTGLYGQWRKLEELDQCELIKEFTGLESATKKTNQNSKKDGENSNQVITSHTQKYSKTNSQEITFTTLINYIYESINPPIYTNIIYPFVCDPPYIHGMQLPQAKNKDVPIGCYRCYFYLPWESPTSSTICNKYPISLLLHGCGPSVFIFLNGCYVGYSTDGFLTAEFDVTQFLVYTAASKTKDNASLDGNHVDQERSKFRNCLVLFVPKFSSASYLEDQDHWRLSGCFRDIELLRRTSSTIATESLVSQHVKSSDCCITPNIDISSLCIEDFVVTALPLGRFTDNTAERGLVQVSVRFGCIPTMSGTTITLKQAISSAKHHSTFNWFGRYYIQIKVYKELTCPSDSSNPDTRRNTDSPENETETSSSSCVIKKQLSQPDFSYSYPSVSLFNTYSQSTYLSLVYCTEACLSIFSSAIEDDFSFSDNWSLAVPSPLLWSDELPELYVVSVTLLKQSDDVHMHQEQEKLININLKPSMPLSPSIGLLPHRRSNFGHATPDSLRSDQNLLQTDFVSTHTDGKNGIVLQSEACYIGFRSVEVISGELLINKQPVMIKGVNRHEHHPLRGKITPWDSIVEDLILMKQNNFNAVRTCHYPNTDEFYKICNRLGLYVVDEANIETHGDNPTAWSSILSFLTVRLLPRVMGRLANDPDWERAWLDRIQRMVFRDRSHPCIIVWSLGNEAGRGQTLRKAYQWIHQIDISERPVQYESGGCPDDHSDIYCPMYPTLNHIISYAMRSNWKQTKPYEGNNKKNEFTVMSTRPRQQHSASGRRRFILSCCTSTEIKRPMILCEYQHAMGNSNGSLMDYWNAFYRLQGLQGGFIWDWVDQGLLKSRIFKDKEGSSVIHYWAYGGDFNDRPNDLNFNINGLVYPDRRLKPGTIETKYVHQPFDIELESIASGRLRSGQATPNVNHNEQSGNSFGSVVLKIKSRLMFTSLCSFTFDYSLFDFLYSYEPIGQGSLGIPTDIGPQSSGIIVFDLPQLPIVDTDKEERWLCLIITGRLKSRTSWGFAGHVVGRRQLWLPILVYPNRLASGELLPSHPKQLQLPPSHPKSWLSLAVKSNSTTTTSSEVPWTVKILLDHPHETFLNVNSSRKASNIDEIEMAPVSPKQFQSEEISLVKEFKYSPSMTKSVNPPNQLEFSNDIYQIRFDCLSGNLVYYQIIDPDTQLYLTPFVEPLQFNFYRAPTDNDRGGGDKQASLMVGLKQVGMIGAIVGALTVGLSREQGLLSYASRWKSIGLDRIESRLVEIRAGGPLCPNRPKHNSIKNDSLWLTVHQSHGPPIKLKRSKRIQKTKPLFRSQTLFIFHPDGIFEIHPQISPWTLSVGYGLPPLPRIGLTITLPVNCRRVTYLGCGPYENYSDRKSSSIVNVHETTVDDMFEPYIYPSEYGGREDTRWVSVTANEPSSEWPENYGLFVEALEESTSTGLSVRDVTKLRENILFYQRFSSQIIIRFGVFQHPNDSSSYCPNSEIKKLSYPQDSTFHFSCHPFSTESIELAKHTCDLGYKLKPRSILGDPMSLEYKPIVKEQNLGDRIRLHIDFEHMGVGGECSWFSCVYSEYIINPAPRRSAESVKWGRPLRIELIKKYS